MNQATQIKNISFQLDAAKTNFCSLLKAQGFEYKKSNIYSDCYKKAGVSVEVYKSGKVVIHGKDEIIKPLLEDAIALIEKSNPEWFTLHAGVDESGKGDYFGPLVSACVIADGKAARYWLENGLRETKEESDTKVLEHARMIQETEGIAYSIKILMPAEYNEEISKYKNLDDMLSSLHAEAIKEALKVKKAPWGMLDKFQESDKFMGTYLREDKIVPLKEEEMIPQIKDGGTFTLYLRPHAEADPIVAAASILAKAKFLEELGKLSEKLGTPLPKGSTAVIPSGIALVNNVGDRNLQKYAKVSFQTTNKIFQELKRNNPY